MLTTFAPFETIIPAAPIVVRAATLQLKGDDHWLRISYTARGVTFSETLQGRCFLELICILTTRLGFNAIDARRILNHAVGVGNGN